MINSEINSICLVSVCVGLQQVFLYIFSITEKDSVGLYIENMLICFEGQDVYPYKKEQTYDSKMISYGNTTLQYDIFIYNGPKNIVYVYVNLSLIGSDTSVTF